MADKQISVEDGHRLSVIGRAIHSHGTKLNYRLNRMQRPTKPELEEVLVRLRVSIAEFEKVLGESK